MSLEPFEPLDGTPSCGGYGMIPKYDARPSMRQRDSSWDPDPIEEILALMERPEWHARAACRGMDPDIFFPPKRGDRPYLAYKTCAACPVRQQCLDFAVRNVEPFGIWGGTSHPQRQKIRTEQRTFCGSQRGYLRHRSRHEPACPGCVSAHEKDLVRQYQRDLVRQRAAKARRKARTA